MEDKGLNMGYYAEIVEGKVKRVLVIDGSTAEVLLWLSLNVSLNLWVETSLDGSIRNKYAGIGDEFDPDIDKFIRTVPFPSWVLDKERGMYMPPIPRPIAILIGYVWRWSIELKDWIKIKTENI